MIYGSTKTKLDYIMANGFIRIDAAIEKVIAKYPTPEPIVTKYEFNLTSPQSERQAKIKIAKYWDDAVKRMLTPSSTKWGEVLP